MRARAAARPGGGPRPGRTGASGRRRPRHATKRPHARERARGRPLLGRDGGPPRRSHSHAGSRVPRPHRRLRRRRRDQRFTQPGAGQRHQVLRSRWPQIAGRDRGPDRGRDDRRRHASAADRGWHRPGRRLARPGEGVRGLPRITRAKARGARVVLDCANGATYRVAPSVFAQTGAEVLTLFDTPDGANINAGCGATQPEALQRAVVDRKADIGFAFDGDGDRVITVDAHGAVHDGDFALALAARHFARHGELDPRLVVGTVMSNGGLEATLARDGIGLVRTRVGDRYVWEEMVRSGALFGGEPSGHVIFRKYHTTGDGILTALEVMHLIRAEGRPLAELSADMERWPQVTQNVKASRRAQWESSTAFVAAIKEATDALGATGRLLVRPSGTEPVLRITVEARDAAVASSTAARLAEVGQKELA